MSEVRDPAITLFGHKIPVPDCQIPAEFGCKLYLDSGILPVLEMVDESREATDMEHESPPTLESVEPHRPLHLGEDAKNKHTISTQDIKAAVDHEPNENESPKTDLGCQQKDFKKQDRILPCPRCNSLNTKFCYFNNYNVNQPRHFCKNCQRYWTAGGAIRNVPVGAGKRKNKQSSVHYRQVLSSDGVPISQVDTCKSTGHQVISCVGRSPCSRSSQVTEEFLEFHTEVPLCESVATVLNLKEQSKSCEMRTTTLGDNSEEPSSSGSSLTSTTFRDNELPEKVTKVEQISLPHCGFAHGHPLQCYTQPPWAYTWNHDWNVTLYGPESCNHHSTQWGSPPMGSAPGFCTPSITLPYVPALYWGCIPGCDSKNFTSPSVGCSSGPSASSTSNTSCSGNRSPTLGKHSRDANLQADDKAEKFFWVPKTLRIDDPDEAAKSSIWSTLSIMPGRKEPKLKCGIFKAFQPKTEGTAPPHADQLLQANPVAFSRSNAFQESM